MDRLLGKGGMGEVYAAFDEKLERDVALKVLVDDSDAASQKKKLLREARLAAKLQHPNIATVYEVDELGERLYIVMELLDGFSLRKILNRRKLPFEEALSIARDVARALSRAHSAGVIHRDIKPENVFVTTPSPDAILAKVLDFGLARQKSQATATGVDQASTDTTTLGDVWGTPGYLSPEQARGRRVDARSDIFSFGVVFYEMLANIRPFRAENPVATMLATLRAEPRPLREIVPDLPPAIDEIVQRCMKKVPDERFAEGAELNAALDAFVRGNTASGKVINVVGSSPSLPLITFDAPPMDAAPTTPNGAPSEAAATGSAANATLKGTELADVPGEEEHQPSHERSRLIAAAASGLGVALVVVVLSLTWAVRKRAEGVTSATSSTATAPADIVAPSVAAPDDEAPATAAESPAPAPAFEIEPDEEIPAEAATDATPTTSPPGTPEPRVVVAPPASAKKRRADDCAQPFVVDAKGVRIPKIHCMK